MSVPIGTAVRLFKRFFQYKDGKWHWRRLSLTALVPTIIAVIDAFKPQLLAAHCYGTVKSIAEVGIGLLAVLTGRDVTAVPKAPDDDVQVSKDDAK